METIVPGVAVTVAPSIVRITAPNPGVMTGPGTNSYIVGQDRLIVVDPGPDIDSHISLLIDAVRDRLDWIVCTHTHLDHSPAARALKAATGARIAGRVTNQDGRQDKTFEVTDRLVPGKWNRVSFVLAPAQPRDLGYVTVAIETGVVSLLQ